MVDGDDTLLVLTGPTAAGKTEIAIAVATAIGDCEILCADSMSVYRRMDIGTAKPSAEERTRVHHWGLDLVEPSETFDSARFVEEADRVIADARSRGKRLLLVGGTPLYLMAVLYGFFDGPSADPALRARLAAEEDDHPGALHDRLVQVDPAAAERIHRNDRKRLVRALEVFELTGRPISEQQQQFAAGRPRYPHRLACLRISRDELRARVQTRTTAMLERGLLEEVRSIESNGGFGQTAASAIGYAEALAFLRNELSAEELPFRIRSSTHRLVRRQETWFRRFPDLTWVDVEGVDTEQSRQLVADSFSKGATA